MVAVVDLWPVAGGGGSVAGGILFNGERWPWWLWCYGTGIFYRRGSGGGTGGDRSA